MIGSGVLSRNPAVAADHDPVRIATFLCLIGFAVFTQLDAVANRLSAGSPISLVELSLGGTIAGTLALLAGGRQATGGARGDDRGLRLMLMLFCWTVFAWALSAHRAEGLLYLVKLATAIAPALCVLVIVDRVAQLRMLLWSMIVAGAVSGVIVLIEARTGTRLVATSLAATTADFDGVARSSGGSDMNPTTAAQMVMVSTILAMAWLFAGERAGRTVLLGATLIGGIALALMSARSAIVGVAAAVGLLLLSLRHDRRFPLILIAAVVVGVAGLLLAPPVLIDRFAAIGDFAQDQTLYRRITYLRIGADLLQSSPIWGIGPGNFPSYYVGDAYRYMPGRVVMPRELHNSFLDTAVEYGIVGFGISAAIVGHAIGRARRAFAPGGSPVLARAGFAIVLALAGLLVACFFMPHKNMRYLWLLIALAIQCGRLRDTDDRTGAVA
ncbi:MAG TPA: O-antigen ligase family protein [Sphingomonas sp.]|jgi:hypothetical protein|uniref:O-antigen ligase family protein n=1 Tax=Sphingomonas sp. TaxID=28214 RepID=UPI002EDB3329